MLGGKLQDYLIALILLMVPPTFFFYPFFSVLLWLIAICYELIFLKRKKCVGFAQFLMLLNLILISEVALLMIISYIRMTYATSECSSLKEQITGAIVYSCLCGCLLLIFIINCGIDIVGIRLKCWLQLYRSLDKCLFLNSFLILVVLPSFLIPSFSILHSARNVEQTFKNGLVGALDLYQSNASVNYSFEYLEVKFHDCDTSENWFTYQHLNLSDIKQSTIITGVNDTSHWFAETFENVDKVSLYRPDYYRAALYYRCGNGCQRAVHTFPCIRDIVSGGGLYHKEEKKIVHSFCKDLISTQESLTNVLYMMWETFFKIVSLHFMLIMMLIISYRLGWLDSLQEAYEEDEQKKPTGLFMTYLQKRNFIFRTRRMSFLLGDDSQSIIFSMKWLKCLCRCSRRGTPDPEGNQPQNDGAAGMHQPQATSTGQKATTTGQKATSTGQKATSTGQKATSTSQKATSTGQKATSTAQKATSTAQKATSTAQKATSTAQKATSTAQKATSTAQKATSTAEKATSAAQKATSTAQKARSTAQKATASACQQVISLGQEDAAFGQNTPCAQELPSGQKATLSDCKATSSAEDMPGNTAPKSESIVKNSGDCSSMKTQDDLDKKSSNIKYNFIPSENDQASAGYIAGSREFTINMDDFEMVYAECDDVAVNKAYLTLTYDD